MGRVKSRSEFSRNIYLSTPWWVRIWAYAHARCVHTYHILWLDKTKTLIKLKILYMAYVYNYESLSE